MKTDTLRAWRGCSERGVQLTSANGVLVTAAINTSLRMECRRTNEYIIAGIHEVKLSIVPRNHQKKESVMRMELGRIYAHVREAVCMEYS